MEREKSLSKVKIIPQIYEGPRGRNGKARLACRTCLSDVSHRAVGRSENPGEGTVCFMGFYVDIYWESRCNIEKNV